MVQEFSSAIEGLDGGGGFNPTSLIQGLSGGSQGGGIGTTIGGVGGAALGSMLLPGIGTVLGGSIGSTLGGLFPGGDAVGAGKGKFAGLHCSYMEQIDDARMTKEDADKYIREANKAGLTVEEMAVWMARDAEYYHQTPSTIWDGYSAGTSLTGVSASEARQTIARYYGGRGEYPALVMYDRKPQVITLKAISASAEASVSTAPIQTMTKAPTPTASASLGQFDQLPYRNVAQVAGGIPALGQGIASIPPLATTPFVFNPSGTSANTPATTPTDNTNTYLAIGGGAIVLLILLAVLLKKH